MGTPGDTVRHDGLWSLPAWRLAFPAAVISHLGDVVFDITVVLWISTDIARGQAWAPAAVAGVLIAAAVPVLVVGPFAGVYVDRHDRHRVMVLANLVQAAAIASLLVLSALPTRSTAATLIWIYTAIGAANAAGQFFDRGRLAMIARTVPEERRTSAFSAQGSANSLVSIVGPPLAAPLLFATGVDAALAVDAFSFVASSVLLQRVRWDSAPAAEAAGQSFWVAMAEGARAIAGNRVLLAITVGIAVATFGAGAVNVLEVFFVTDVLHRHASLLGVLNMMFAAGSVLGMLVAPRWERRIGAARVYLVGLLGSGLLLAAYSRVTVLVPAMLLYFLTAVPLGTLNTVVTPLFMRTIPPAVLGRSVTVVQVSQTVANLVGMGASGWLVSTLLHGLRARVGPTTFGPVDSVFFASGIVLAAAAILTWRPITREEAANPTREETRAP